MTPLIRGGPAGADIRDGSRGPGRSLRLRRQCREHRLRDSWGIRLLGETGWFKPAGLEKLQRKFEERPVGRRQSMYMKLWLLFGLQVWLDNYVNKVDPYDHIMRSIS